MDAVLVYWVQLNLLPPLDNVTGPGQGLKLFFSITWQHLGIRASNLFHKYKGLLDH